MAKSRKALTVRRITSKEERDRPSIYLRLKEGESFTAYALFEPDPSKDANKEFKSKYGVDNPLFEYLDHWDQQARTYVPCAGEECTFCAINNNPSSRGLTTWYLPDNNSDDRIKVFTMNFGTMKDASDIAEEEEGFALKKFRVKRIDDKGAYRIRPTSDKALTMTEGKKILKGVPDLEELLQGNLERQWARLQAVAAVEDVDDDEDEDDEDEDEEEETPKARRGQKAKAKTEPEDDDDDDDDDDDEEEDEDEEEADDDDDDDDEEEEEADDDDDDDEDATGSSIEDYEVKVIKVNSTNEIFTGMIEGEKKDVYTGDGLAVDWDEIKKGVTVVIDAEVDDEGDWVMTSIAVKGDKPKPRRKAAAKK